VEHSPDPKLGLRIPRRIRRKVPRYTFIAVTEILAGRSQAFLLAKTRQISCQGCFVETPNTLPVGTSLDIVISRDQGTFATKGRVIYVHEGFGMGIMFTCPTSDELKVLDSWLAGRSANTDIA
jgi:hypothetical protein